MVTYFPFVTCVVGGAFLGFYFLPRRCSCVRLLFPPTSYARAPTEQQLLCRRGGFRTLPPSQRARVPEADRCPQFPYWSTLAPLIFLIGQSNSMSLSRRLTSTYTCYAVGDCYVFALESRLASHGPFGSRSSLGCARGVILSSVLPGYTISGLLILRTIWRFAGFSVLRL